MSGAKFLPFFFLSLLLCAALSSAVEYRIGGPDGWTRPAGSKWQNYNHWSKKTTFHVGDSLYFKYVNESVLLVDKDGYKECNTTGPMLKFVDGHTTFTLEREGFYHFISGQPGHCEAGVRMIVRVGVPTAAPPNPSETDSANHSGSVAAVKSAHAAALVAVVALGSALWV